MADLDRAHGGGRYGSCRAAPSVTSFGAAAFRPRRSTSRSGRPRAARGGGGVVVLDLDPAAGDLDPRPGGRRRRRRPRVAPLRPALDRRGADAEAAGLGEQHGGQPLDVGGVARARATVCAGRPFFITIGVAQASWAPAARSAAIVWASTSPVTSSTLTSSCTAARPGRGRRRLGAVASPTTTCTTLGRPAVSARAGAVADRRRRSSPAARRSDVGERGEHGDAGRRRQLHRRCRRRSTGTVAAASRRATAGAGLGRLAVGGADRAVARRRSARRRCGRCPARRARRRRRRRRRSRRARRPRGARRRRGRCRGPRPRPRPARRTPSGLGAARRSGRSAASSSLRSRPRRAVLVASSCVVDDDVGPRRRDAAALDPLERQRVAVDAEAGRAPRTRRRRSAPASTSAPSSMSPATPAQQLT